MFGYYGNRISSDDWYEIRQRSGGNTYLADISRVVESQERRSDEPVPINPELEKLRIQQHEDGEEIETDEDWEEETYE